MGIELIDVFKKQLGWTNEELARASGVPKATIDKITAGRTTNPNLETAKALVYAMGKTLDDLETKQSPPAPEQGAQEGKVSVDEVVRAFVAAGLVSPGQDLADADLRFLMGVIDLIDLWFANRNQQ